MKGYIKCLVRFCFVCSLLSFSISFASEPEAHDYDNIKRSAQAQVYYEQIQQVLAQKAFGEKKKVKQWRLKEQKEEEKNEEKSTFIKWLEELFKRNSNRDNSNDGVVSLAQGVEVLIWALVIGLIVYLVFKYRTQIQTLVAGLGAAPEATELPSTMFGLDVKKTSMPEDVVASAKAFWQSGEQRQAVALLLRASLIKLLHEHQCFFQDSDTEAECCARIEKHVPKPLSQYMDLLVQVWQQIAYGHRVPTQDVFNSLCRQWQEVF